MAISPINCEVQGLSKRCGHPAFGSETSANASANSKPADLNKEKKSDEFLKKLENMPPAAVGLSSALVWFGIGIGIDRLMGVIFKSKYEIVAYLERNFWCCYGRFGILESQKIKLKVFYLKKEKKKSPRQFASAI